MTEPVEEAGPSSFVDSLGERGLRRAEPRASIAIAGAGCALGIVGVLVIAGDTGLDESGGDFNRVPGILLTALVVVGGYALLANLRRGPLATAGAVAAAAGVPPLLFFLTFDANDLPPYSTEGILLISTGAWLVSYVLGPGRGRPVFLGAGLIGAWLSLLQLTEQVFTAPFDQIEAFSDAPIDSFDPETGEIIEGGPLGSVTSQPDLVTIGLLSLGLGIAFVVIGRWLDRQGQHGAATPCTVAGLPCLAVGVGALAPDLEAAGTGLLLAVIGLALAHHGAAVGRRATSWIGAAAMAVGMGVFLIDMAPEDDATVGGMLLLAGGIAMVGAGHALATARREPDEMLVTIGVGAGVGEPPAARHQVSASLPAPPPPPAPEPEASSWAPPPAPAPTPPPDPDPTAWAPPTDPPDPPAPT